MIAPPTPWPLRDTISISGSWATPHSSDPSVKMTSPMLNSRFRPYRSASTPEVSSSEASVSAYASRTHCTSLKLACRPAWIAGWATMTIVTSSSSMNVPVHTASSVHHFLSIGSPPSPGAFPGRRSPCCISVAMTIHAEARLRRISTVTTLYCVEVMSLDDVDRQIIHILTIEPRASFRVIAEVTGISDQTAARRYRRLSEHAGLRVLGVLNGAQLGWVEWFLRLQTAPGSADSIADALARRPDTRWVRLASGGTEIICVVEARDPEQRDALFLRGLPGSRRVVQISAHSILHDFHPGPWQAVTTALSEAQLAALSRGADPAGPRLRGSRRLTPLTGSVPCPGPRSGPVTSC